MHSINIVGRIDRNTGIARHTLAFANTLRDVYACRFVDTRPEESDPSALPDTVALVEKDDSALCDAIVSVFTDVTSNGPTDLNWQRVPITNRKYIYSVFDSTRIPGEWADIINKHFDAVFVPSKCLVGVYRRSSVQKPVFHLPLAIDLQPFLEMPTPSFEGGRPFVFGFLGSREARKNIDLLVDCFTALFRDNTAVALRIHCALDFHANPTYFTNLARRARNVIVTHGVLESDAYTDLVSSIDCFVSLSRGEGYSIVPREFLAAGKPVILGECLAHADILAELRALGPDLGFSVDADIPVRAFYPHVYGGGPFGVQFEPYRPAAISALERVFAHRHELFTKNLVDLRRRWARKFDMNALKPLYRSIIEPAFARKTTDDVLEFGGISTKDPNLLSRITGANHSIGLTDQLRERPVKYVVIGNDGGFFSVFNRFVSYLTWATTEHPDSVVLPDWRIEAMQEHWRRKTFTSFCYGTVADGNIWLKLFEPLPYRDFPEESYHDSFALYRNAELKDDYNEQRETWLTYIHAYKLYKSPMFQRWRNWYHLYLSAYVRLRPHIAQRIDSIYEKHLKRYTVISAHIRHPSHGIEQPGARVPTVELYCQRIRELIAREKLHTSELRIFLATDQSSVVKQMASEFGNMLVVSSDVARTSAEDDARFAASTDPDKMREGFQVQHLAAADSQKWSLKMAEDVLVDTYLLARGDHFLHITSNIATAVAYINPRIKMHYCE